MKYDKNWFFRSITKHFNSALNSNKTILFKVL